MKFYELLYNNRWYLSICIFAVTLAVWVILSMIKNNRKKHALTPGNIVFIGVFLSAFFYFMPLYSEDGITGWTAIFASVQHSFSIFGLDGDFLDFIAKRTYPENADGQLYTLYGAVLYAFAPVLTFSFILTFFKNFFAHLKYKTSFLLQTHVFSELNEKSLALAKSIVENKKPFLKLIPRVVIVFTDVIDKKEELHFDLVEQAKGMGAVLFRKDLESIHFKSRISLRKVYFYLISEDESEIIRHAESIMEQYDYKRVGLWIFSDDIRTELMLAKNNVNNMDVTRVNDIQSLIYHNLDTYGINLFKRCRTVKGKKIISAVIVGLGKYGQEMLKALTWYCQLGDYTLKINVFDADETAKEKFMQQCPELLDDKYNKKRIAGTDAYYEIDIHNGVDVCVPDFEKKLGEIKDATYIFVCLGDDETNLGAAAEIRSMCERIDYEGDGRKPVIETVIYDSNIRKKLGITWKDIENNDKINQAEPNRNKKRYEYDILITGDLESFYSEKTVINFELKEEGFEVHTFWSLEPARISFAENYMAKEWDGFTASENLKSSWAEYYNKSLKLSDAINEFSFMTKDETADSEKFKTAADTESLEKLADTVIRRKHKWEKQVHEKYNELIKIRKYFKEWKRIEIAKTAEAKKSFRFEYNYRSSIAKAIHKRLRKALGFRPDITDKPWEKMTYDDKVELGKIEHVRWNAYMRTEGYGYSSTRNDLTRVHHNLVPVDKLSNDDLRKDA